MIMVTIAQPYIIQQTLTNKWWLNSGNMMISILIYIFSLSYVYGDAFSEKIV